MIIDKLRIFCKFFLLLGDIRIYRLFKYEIGITLPTYPSGKSIVCFPAELNEVSNYVL